jgi:hypothetical protein
MRCRAPIVIPRRGDGEGPHNCNAGLLAPPGVENMGDANFAQTGGALV